MTGLLALLLSVATVAAVEAVLYARSFSRDRRARELKRRVSAIGPDAAESDREALLRRGRFARNATLEALLQPLGPAQRLEKLVEQADAPVTVAQILGWSAGLAGAGVFLAVAFGRVAFLAVAAGGALAPTLWLLAARARRARRLSEQLPEALEMMSRSLRAGHALSAAFELVAHEMPEPACVEFARAFEEQRLGLSFDEAVLRMAARTPSNGDVKLFAISAVIQRETGGNLAEILDKIAATVRGRYRFHGKLRALTAEGRASALVVGALPILTLLLLSVLNPKYISQLFVDPLGNAILAVGTACWIVGQLAMYRLTKVEL